MIDRFHNPWFAINNIKQYKVQKINTQTMRRYQDVLSKRKPAPSEKPFHRPCKLELHYRIDLVQD